MGQAEEVCGWEAPPLSPGFPALPPAETTEKVSMGICALLKLGGTPGTSQHRGDEGPRAVTEMSAAGVPCWVPGFWSGTTSLERPLSAALGTARVWALVLGVGVLGIGVYSLFVRSLREGV